MGCNYEYGLTLDFEKRKSIAKNKINNCLRDCMQAQKKNSRLNGLLEVNISLDSDDRKTKMTSIWTSLESLQTIRWRRANKKSKR